MSSGTTVTEVRWKNGKEKADWLDGKASLDARIPLVRQFAGRLAKARDPNRPDLRAADFQRWVRDSIRYVPDPAPDAVRGQDNPSQEFEDSETVLSRAWGNCVAKARLFVALCRAVGIEARIRPVFTGQDFTHAQAEVRWPGVEKDPRVQPNGWIMVELIVKGLELGDDVPEGTRTLA